MDDNECSARILLAVWGESFIKHFLESSLPTLLAPGNVPALAANYPLTFVFLTRPSDIPIFEASRAYQKLVTICNIEFISISDLIQFTNYSSTLTYAFDRAIRQTGDAMLKTYFIFLTSDYLMADGSLRGLMRYMKKGFSGICAGNFQVVEEKITPKLAPYYDTATHVMQIAPRQLIEYSLPYLHPVTIASMINQKAVHNYRANRFFYAENQDTLAGRFYLLHMLCIKPETTDYQIGSSCDYSFIPAMCPSGNVAVINDSDDYLVVEAQPGSHELNHLIWGEYQEKKLLQALNEWTTDRHRQNSNTTIYFHSRDLTDTQKNKTEQELGSYIHQLNEQLQQLPAKSSDNHPYWLGKSLSNLSSDHDTAENNSEYINYFAKENYTRARRLYFAAFGCPPAVYSWHYRWLEYRSVLQNIKSYLRHQQGQTLILYSAYTLDFLRYRDWFDRKSIQCKHVLLPQWLRNKKSDDASFHQAIIFIRANDMTLLQKALEQLKQHMLPASKILLIAANINFSMEFLANLTAVTNHEYKVDKVTPVFSNASSLGTFAIEQIQLHYSFNRKKRLMIYSLLAIPGTLIITALNWFGKLFSSIGHCTNILVTLQQERSDKHV